MLGNGKALSVVQQALDQQLVVDLQIMVVDPVCLKWLKPPLLLLGALAWFLGKRCNKPAADVAAAVDKLPMLLQCSDAAAAEAKRVADSIAATISKFSLPGGFNLEVKKSFTDKSLWLSDTTAKIRS